MESPKLKIYSLLAEIAIKLGVEDANFLVERPKDSAHGDFSSNIGLTLFAKLKSQNSKFNNPFEVAEEVVNILNINNNIQDVFDRIEVVAPGFINFWLSDEFLKSKLLEIIRVGDAYGSLAIGAGKKASVEYVSANPTGPLHIGNARGGPIGDVIANVLSKAGYKVIREYLHNDVGGQVSRLGESIYYNLHPDQKSETLELQYQAEYITDLAKIVEETLQDKEMDLSADRQIEEMGKVAVELMLSEIIKDCEAMGITFDKVRKESDLRHEVPQVLSKIKQFLKEKDGAMWFAPNDEFLKDRETVVKKSDGNFTYFASDIAYHNEKMTANDLVVDILGSNHSGHVPRLLAVIKALGHTPQDFRCILYQYVRLKRKDQVVKMGKRFGTFVTAREVVDEVGKDAFRFFMLSSRSETHMDFNLELAKNQSADNPVFYVQYAYTRICGIFEKSKLKNMEGVDLADIKEKEELNLARKLLEFPYLIEEVSQNFEVNALITYSTELANLFHKFYEAHQVISDNEKLTHARLGLLKATQITLKNTLDLLGVSAPYKM